MSELNKYRKLVGPIVVAVYAIARAFGYEPGINEDEATANITALIDALIPIVGVFLVYVLPNEQ